MVSRVPCTHKPYDHDNQDDRRRAVAGAIASNRAEGLEPDAESLADLEEYVVGAIDLADVRTRAAARYFGQEATCSASPDFN
ncbi:hypothetical protein EV663_105170 [Rhodovulum bhavnagarense]|uniref:Antitoxin VbhA domain-containing protein n=1 Tax=Rhodovulum bhavnagarense TaxID=992286 RepID=A0A4R2RDD4_9RHOB|nr:hypothetical protein EV663_105170 [Rhodovulum bhavnagarense]